MKTTLEWVMWKDKKPEKKEAQGRAITFECDSCSNDGWIWPLKQLPEKGQKVEVMFFVDNKIEKDAFFDGKIFRGRHYVGYSNVIAWRPLREFECINATCKNKYSDTDKSMHCKDCRHALETRKPDFNKLKEGDLVVVNLEKGHIITGFFYSLYKICDIGFIDISNMRDRMIDRKLGQIELSKIKKIIRINIDNQKRELPAYCGAPDQLYYSFEEI
jgi:hypothetical protein